MTENLEKAFLISKLIAYYYKKLIQLTVVQAEDSEEYIEYIKKIQKAKIAEKQMYQSLTLNEIVDYIKSKRFQEDIAAKKTLSQVRIYKILRNVGQSHLEEDYRNNPILSEIVENSIIIEALKKTNRKIEDLDETTIENFEFLNMLKLNNKVSKYGILMDNDLLEDLALKYHFDIEKIPLISLKQIKKDQANPSILNSVLYIKFFREITGLKHIKRNEPVDNTYYAYIKLSMLEIMLENMDKNTLKKVITKFERENEDNHIEIIEYVKELTRKKKEN